MAKTKGQETEKPTVAVCASATERSRRYLRGIQAVMDEQISGLNHTIRLYNHHLRIVDPKAHPLEVTISGAVFKDVDEVEKDFEAWKRLLLSLKRPRTSAEADDLIIAVGAEDRGGNGDGDFFDAGSDDSAEEEKIAGRT